MCGDEEEEEDSGTGSGSETDRSGGDTASESGSQHTTPDNVSAEQIEHEVSPSKIKAVEMLGDHVIKKET